MSFLKRAWLSITRRTGKSLLLLLIILILGNAIAGAISIQQASINVEKKIKADMGAAATIRVDYAAMDKLWEEFQNNPEDMPETAPPTPELMQMIGESPYVKYFDYSTESRTGSSALQRFIPQFFLEQDMGMNDDWDKYYAFILRGVQYHKILAIEEGRLNLVGGRVFTEEEINQGAPVAIISKALAELNHINIDDTIVLTNYVMDYQNYNDETGMPNISKEIDNPVKVIGFVEAATTPASQNQSSKNEGDKWNQAWTEQQNVNTVYMPNGFISKINRNYRLSEIEANPEMYDDVKLDDMQFDWYEPIYILNSTDDIEKFKEEVTPLLPERYLIATAADNYENIAAPVEQTSKMANYVLIVAIVASVLIVSLVVLLFLRDRKHELGVYLSLGESKSKVLGQIIAEVLIIALVGIVLSVFTGNLIASGLSGSMIQAQLEKQAEGEYWGEVYYSSGINDYMNSDLTMEDVAGAYEIRLTPSYVLIFFLVSMGTIALSTLVPMIYIVRLNPRKILM
ncbi:MAG: ABC transporter permease [Tissierellia bacterium]|nr:ABC transporter permease [Bacillota bacterium]NLL22447.1 ABC transporter permease [Tissierellia bacterium]